MTKKIILILLSTIFSVSLFASSEINSTNDSVKSYLSFDKLNENIYSSENKDKILGLGVDIKSTKNMNFIIAYEGGVYNENSNVIATDPIYKVNSYINSGAISYKLNYKF